MRGILQRVKKASVSVEGEIVGKIEKGLVLFLGIGKEDDESDLDYLVNKVLGLRIFEDEDNKMNLSLLDVKGELLVISQFTLYGDVRKGRRPSFTESGHPEIAEKYYLKFIQKCIDKGVKTEKGIFGADMEVKLNNKGPVTIMIDSKKNF